MAAICRNRGAIVDVFLPILLDKAAALGPEVMPGIFLQFKLRELARTPSAYIIDEDNIRFFSRDPADGDGQTLRPYISLIMELGVTNPPSLLQREPTRHHSQTAAVPSKQKHQSGSPPPIQASLLNLDIFTDSSRSYKKDAHPRHSLYVYGCSPSVYKVISEPERPLYKLILRSGDPLGEHSQKNDETLSAVWNQKPFFALRHGCWDWLQSAHIQPGTPGGIVVYDRVEKEAG
ncbi:hypothetical protein PUNSTDRAFT_139014 [Punctularia strigosozonata HHB-11173 SS5]|uniref:Uncharacterized protein n=1 Tax=Punctularia strigosozonata (strain HHB-11173) TaxID=741275 RepID=R7S2G2_PUNST|nr:uncharacterized protein PUNSTDRAFT_139014 [Punctularia strigosozonata HHB-11173 SS5]EIN03972.1 hypothetical protein PUNSTDRAFT_139014 [Punctularia strigosozonata HHB-11173 SS5]